MVSRCESASRCFQQGEGPSKGLLRDCKNRWIVCSSIQKPQAPTPTEKALIHLLVHLIVVHEPAADLRELLVVGGGQHEPAQLPHARGLHVEGPVHGGGGHAQPWRGGDAPPAAADGYWPQWPPRLSCVSTEPEPVCSHQPAQPSPALHCTGHWLSPARQTLLTTYGIGCHQLRTLRPFITKMIGTTFSLALSACTGPLI